MMAVLGEAANDGRFGGSPLAYFRLNHLKHDVTGERQRNGRNGRSAGIRESLDDDASASGNRHLRSAAMGYLPLSALVDLIRCPVGVRGGGRR